MVTNPLFLRTIDLMKKKEETAKRLQMKAIELEQANSKNEALQAQINALEFYYNDCQNKIKEVELKSFSN